MSARLSQNDSQRLALYDVISDVPCSTQVLLCLSRCAGLVAAGEPSHLVETEAAMDKVIGETVMQFISREKVKMGIGRRAPPLLIGFCRGWTSQFVFDAGWGGFSGLSSQVMSRVAPSSQVLGWVVARLQLCASFRWHPMRTGGTAKPAHFALADCS